MSSVEWIITGIIPISAFLFAWGGGGLKWMRRFIMPIVMALGGFLLGIIWWRCLIMMFLTIGAMCLGYGENHPMWRKILVVSSFGICLLPLATGINAFFILIPPIVFGLNYLLSRKFNWWTWKLVELAIGFSLGFTIVLLALTQ